MSDAARPYQRMRPLLGTYVEIGANPDAAQTEVAAVTAAFHSIANIHQQLSFHDPESELSTLNRSLGQPVRLSRHSLCVLKLAKRMMLASQGRFNCTVGGTLVNMGLLPDHGGRLIELGTADDIQIAGQHAWLRRPVRITLDGIAKGYAVDLGIKTLKYHGIKSGWINAGGDLRAFGDIVLPVQQRCSDGSMALLGGIKDAAIASSQMAIKPDARFPAWIVGQDSRQDKVYSVMAPTAWRADALTKVACVCADDDLRESLIRQLGGRLIHPADIH